MTWSLILIVQFMVKTGAYSHTEKAETNLELRTHSILLAHACLFRDRFFPYNAVLSHIHNVLEKQPDGQDKPL